MAKTIAFIVIDNGIDCKAKNRIIYANENEAERDKWFDAAKNKKWYRKAEQIIDAEKIKTDVIARMDGIEKMVMGIPEDKIIKSENIGRIIKPTTSIKGAY